MASVCVIGTNPESSVEQHDQILYFEHESCICTIGLEQRKGIKNPVSNLLPGLMFL
jgi:hypothetical protein